MIEFKVRDDYTALALLGNLSNFRQYMNEFMEDIAEAFGTEGVSFIKPHTRGNGKWKPLTGATERGIDFTVLKSHEGFTINFLGRNRTNKSPSGTHNIAHMIDVGNFPPGERIFARNYSGENGPLKAFPITGRAGSITDYFASVRGMGASSPEYPKNFSEKAVKHLHKEVKTLAESSLQSLLNKLVP